MSGGCLRAKPGASAIARQFLVTLLCGIAMVVMAMMFGVPPGSRRVARQQDRVQRAEQAVHEARKRYDRIRTSTSGPDSVVTEGARRTLDIVRGTLESEKRRLEGTAATLGPTGDALCWTAAGLLAVVGVGLPIYACFVRVTFEYEGPPGRGVLRMVTRPIGRTKSFEVGSFIALHIHVQRVVSHNRRHHTTIDHGWLWSVLSKGDPQRGDTRDLVIQPLLAPNLPVHVKDLTPEVRTWIRYLEGITALEHESPMTTDVIDVRANLLGTKIKMVSRIHR